MAKSDFSDFKYYNYNPSLAAAVIFVVLFLATTILHVYQLLRTRTWFMVPLVVGGFFEWIGYIGRAVSSQQTPDWTLSAYLVQTLLLLVAPALFAASIYMELGRIIALVDGEAQALIRKKWLTKLFVGGDVLSFLLQSAGGGVQASKTADAHTTGSRLVVGGLLVQLFFFGFFVIVAITFDIAVHRVPTLRSQSGVPWRKHLIALYFASVLVVLRSIFRVVEYLQGFSGYLLSHEYYLYIFDAVLMLCVMVIFNVVHPSEVVALTRGGNVARKGWKMQKISGHDHSLPDDSRESA